MSCLPLGTRQVPGMAQVLWRTQLSWLLLSRCRWSPFLRWDEEVSCCRMSLLVGVTHRVYFKSPDLGTGLGSLNMRHAYKKPKHKGSPCWDVGSIKEQSEGTRPAESPSSPCSVLGSSQRQESTHMHVTHLIEFYEMAVNSHRHGSDTWDLLKMLSLSLEVDLWDRFHS